MGKFKDFFKKKYVLLSSAVILGILLSISIYFHIFDFLSIIFSFLMVIPVSLSLAFYNMFDFSNISGVIFQILFYFFWFIFLFLLIKFSYLKLKKRFSSKVSVLLTILIIFGFYLFLFLIIVFLSTIFVGLFSFGG